VAGLALLVGVLAVEANVHAVHHLNDAQAAAQCVVAVVSAQVNGTLEQPPSVDDALAGAPVDSVLAPSPERPGSRSRRPDEGRAPPTA
jgi:hypothetical protein